VNHIAYDHACSDRVIINVRFIMDIGKRPIEVALTRISVAAGMSVGFRHGMKLAFGGVFEFKSSVKTPPRAGDRFTMLIWRAPASASSTVMERGRPAGAKHHHVLALRV